MESHAAIVFPYDKSIHLLTPVAGTKQQELIELLRLKIKSSNISTIWCTDDILTKFLIARNNSVDKAYELIVAALKWRKYRGVDNILADKKSTFDLLYNESITGKIYISGKDMYGRSIIIFDNTVQNTHNVDNQMYFLAWSLEYAIRLMSSTPAPPSSPSHSPSLRSPPSPLSPVSPSTTLSSVADKYVVFMHLSNFSLFNCPPWKATTETISMLCTCFPERLGHCICFHPPSYFITFFNAVKGLLDAKTRNKVVFIHGDISDGSANDKNMKLLIGKDWKALTGAGQTALVKGSSPGYDHNKNWDMTMLNYRSIIVGGDQQISKSIHTSSDSSSSSSDSCSINRIENPQTDDIPDTDGSESGTSRTNSTDRKILTGDASGFYLIGLIACAILFILYIISYSNISSSDL